MLPDHYKSININLLVKLLLDTFAFVAALFFSFIFVYSSETLGTVVQRILPSLPFFLAIQLVCFLIFKHYSYIWRYAGLHVLLNIIKAVSLGTGIIIILFFLRNIGLPRSVAMIDWVLAIFFTGGVRLMVRKFLPLISKTEKNHNQKRRVLIYGAGSAGELLLRNIESMLNIDINVIGFVDDDPLKSGKYIHNKRVLGSRNDLGNLVVKYNIEEIYFSIPRLSGSETRTVLNAIREQVADKVSIKTIPSLTDLVSGRASINQIRNFEIKDLLRREPVSLDFGPVQKLIKEHPVLVAGGGGSIGLELCTQIAAFHPARIIIMDNSEYNCYRAEEKIQKLFPNLNLNCIVADACNEALSRMIFNQYRPRIVFHAAAYKHVPLMEFNPWAAIYNNLKSTLLLTQLSEEFGVDKFVLVSTDKAVQPTSVMGATKRICELIALHQSENGGPKCITVRFGNVMGSSGSVIYKFKKQIEQGESLTVTHPDITRYFMLISEAVELVLQAGAIGKNGNIYILDMGDPIKIVDLAKYMVELSGLKLNEDIKITYTGLRPGEKLHENLLLEGKEKKTEVPNLFVLEQKSLIGPDYFKKVHSLLNNLYQMDHRELRLKLKELVPEYQPNLDIHSALNNNHEPEYDLNMETVV